MHPAMLVLVIGILWWGFVAIAGQDRATRRRWADVALGAGVLVLLLFLLRIGLPGLALAAGALWAVIRYLGPPATARVLPRRHPRQRSTDEARENSHAGHSDDPDAAALQRHSTNMTRVEAFEVLGLEEGAPEEAIQRAHRELIKKIHPDVGGSARLAAEVNRARDVLLQGK